MSAQPSVTGDAVVLVSLGLLGWTAGKLIIALASAHKTTMRAAKRAAKSQRRIILTKGIDRK